MQVVAVPVQLEAVHGGDDIAYTEGSFSGTAGHDVPHVDALGTVGEPEEVLDVGVPEGGIPETGVGEAGIGTVLYCVEEVEDDGGGYDAGILFLAAVGHREACHPAV